MAVTECPVIGIQSTIVANLHHLDMPIQYPDVMTGEAKFVVQVAETSHHFSAIVLHFSSDFANAR